MWNIKKMQERNPPLSDPQTCWPTLSWSHQISIQALLGFISQLFFSKNFKLLFKLLCFFSWHICLILALYFSKLSLNKIISIMWRAGVNLFLWTAGGRVVRNLLIFIEFLWCPRPCVYIYSILTVLVFWLRKEWLNELADIGQVWNSARLWSKVCLTLG